MTTYAVSIFRNGVRLSASEEWNRIDPKDDPNWLIWISLANPTQDDLQKVRDRYELTLPACLEVLCSSRHPQIEDYGDYRYLSLPTIGTPGCDAIAILLGPGYVVTIDHGASNTSQRYTDRLHDCDSGLRLTALQVVYGILDLVIRDYGAAIDAQEGKVTAFVSEDLQGRTVSTEQAAAAKLRVRLVSIIDTLERLVELRGDLAGPVGTPSADDYFAPFANLFDRARASAKWAEAILRTLDAATAYSDSRTARDQGRRRMKFLAGLFLSLAIILIIQLLARDVASRPITLLLGLAIFTARFCVTLCAAVLLLRFLKARSRSRRSR